MANYFDQFDESKAQTVPLSGGKIDPNTKSNSNYFDQFDNNQDQESPSHLSGGVEMNVPAQIAEGALNIIPKTGEMIANLANQAIKTVPNLPENIDKIPSQIGLGLYEGGRNLANAAFGGKQVFPDVVNNPNTLQSMNNDLPEAYKNLPAFKEAQQKDNQYIDYMRSGQEQIPLVGTLASSAPYSPFFTQNILKNMAIGGGIGFLGTDGNLSDKISYGGAGALVPALGGVPKLVGATTKGIASNTSNIGANIPKEGYLYALGKELAGNSLFDPIGKNTWNAETAYNPVSQKMNAAYRETFTPEQTFLDKLKILPKNLNMQAQKSGQQLENFANQYFTPESNFNTIYKNLGDRINQGLDFLEEKLGKRVGEESSALAQYNDHYIPYNDVIKTINDAVNKYSSGEYNSARKGISKQLGEIYYDLLDMETNPNTGGIRPLELHGIKERIQDLARQAYSKDNNSRGERLLMDTGDKINQILRQYPEYAQAMDNYSSLINLEKDLPSGQELTKSLANLNDAKTYLTNKRDILQQVDNALPDEYKFISDLNKALLEQERQVVFKGNLKNPIFDNISKYNNAPLDVQNAFNILDKLSGKNVLKNYSQTEQNANFIQNLLGGTQEQENILKNLLRKDVFKNPALLKESQTVNSIVPTNNRFSNLNYNQMSPSEAFQTLNDIASPQNKFMPELNDIYLRSLFEKPLPGKGGGSGSTEGAKNIARAAVAAKLGPAAWGLFSPRFGYKNSIRFINFLDKFPTQAISNPAILLNSQNNIKALGGPDRFSNQN